VWFGCNLTFNRLNSFILQKRELYATAAVITSDAYRMVSEKRFLWRIHEPKWELIVGGWRQH
jgi:hypothetical protein